MRLPRFRTILETGFWLSIIGFAGIALSTILSGLAPQSEFVLIGAKILFLTGIFITSYAFVQRGLEKFGAVNFGFSAFISIIGFLFLYAPILSVLLGTKVFYLSPVLKTVLVIIGISFIIFGLLTEQFDLNQKIAKQIAIALNAIKEIIEKINWKKLYHPANLLTIVAITIIALKYFGEYLGGISWLYVGIISGTLVLLNIVLMFPKEFFELFKSIAIILQQSVLFIISSLKNLPFYLKSFFTYLFNSIKKATIFIANNDYVLLPFIGVGAFFVAPLNVYSRTSILLLSILIAIFRLSVVNPRLLRRGLAVTRSNIFKYSVKARTFRRKPDRCVHCGRKISKPGDYCPYCGGELYKDMISGRLLKRTDVVRQCPHCGHLGKVEYLDQWLIHRNTCPYCKQPFSVNDSQAMPLQEFLITHRPPSSATPVSRKIFESFNKLTFSPNKQSKPPKKTTQKTDVIEKTEKIKRVVSEETKKALIDLSAKAMTGELDKEEVKKLSKKTVKRIINGIKENKENKKSEEKK